MQTVCWLEQTKYIWHDNLKIEKKKIPRKLLKLQGRHASPGKNREQREAGLEDSPMISYAKLTYHTLKKWQNMCPFPRKKNSKKGKISG